MDRELQQNCPARQKKSHNGGTPDSMCINSVCAQRSQKPEFQGAQFGPTTIALKCFIPSGLLEKDKMYH